MNMYLYVYVCAIYIEMSILYICIDREVDICKSLWPWWSRDTRCGVFRFRLGSSAGGARAESLVGCDEGFSVGVSARVQMWTKYQFGLCGVLRQRWCGILRGELVEVFEVNVRWRGAWVDTCPRWCGCSPWRHVMSQSLEAGM